MSPALADDLRTLIAGEQENIDRWQRTTVYSGRVPECQARISAYTKVLDLLLRAAPAPTAPVAAPAPSAPEDAPVLCVLMRNDLPSLNPGKACAQATHAANACVYLAEERNDREILGLLRAWQAQSDSGFGTCLVRAAAIRDIHWVVSSAEECRLHAGLVHDQSYPVRDGAETYHVPVDTCAFVFGPASRIKMATGGLPLMD